MTTQSLLVTPSAAVDPTLDALFASSAGPIDSAAKPRYSDWVLQKDVYEDSEGDSDLGSVESRDSSDNGVEVVPKDTHQDPRPNGEVASELVVSTDKKDPRRLKRKRADDQDDVEGRYLQKVAEEDKEEDATAKRLRRERIAADDADGDIDPSRLIHETLLPSSDENQNELEKASRTVFLSNVSTEAIKSKTAKKQLLAHLGSVLGKNASPAQTVSSLRFRSVPVATAAMPKRAAVITQAVMDATTKSTNAYAVYSDIVGARAAISKLNGTVVLDRHLRVDSVAHPAQVDHRRCVFVGNLGFVDDETVISVTTDGDGKEKTEKRKRTKVPMDIEEGLWRTFGKSGGKVENVRVVRDPATRVGKGFAYVQFYDENSVESALLLDGKRFPPLLPRSLRVTRCKAPQKTERALERSAKARAAALADAKPKGIKYIRKLTVEERTSAGRAEKLFGRAAASRVGRPHKSRGRRQGEVEAGSMTLTFKSPGEVVFEGKRASAKDGKPRDLKMKGMRGSKKTKTRKDRSNNEKRRATRAANWKKKGSI